MLLFLVGETSLNYKLFIFYSLKMKKFLSSVLVSALFFGLMSVQAQTFDDVSEDYLYYDAIEYLAEEGVIQGYGDGDFNPDNKINRAEFLKILFLADEAKVTGEGCFGDVSTEWFAPYVCAAQEREIVQGYDDGNFCPQRTINFAEAAKMLAEFFDLYTYRSSGSGWYAPYVLGLEDMGAIPAEIDSFDYEITRGQTAEMIWRIKTGQTDLFSNTYDNIANGLQAGEVEEVDTSLNKFSSCEEAKEYVLANIEENKYGYDYGWYEDVEEEQSVARVSDTVAPTAGSIALDDADSDYSETNVQVEGVDEADIVKTDGEYLYLVKDDSIRIIDAQDPYSLREISSITFSDETFMPEEMYLSDDIATIIGQSYSWDVKSDEVKSAWYSGGLTKVYMIDISNKNSMKIDREVAVEGYMNSSRKVDDMLYLVTNLSRYYYPIYYRDYEDDYILDSADESEEDTDDLDLDEFLPHYRDSAEGNETEIACACDDIYYPPYADPQSYLLVFAIPTDNINKSVEKQVIMGGGDTIYASTENLYVADNTYNWYSGYSANTVIYKFSLGDELDYLGKGEVEGTLLNQFSMDEHDDNLRVVTTTQMSWSSGLSNNLFILDEDLEVIGELNDLAEGEKIYSARFMGDRAYMVTFKQIDPLFVFDLSDPTSPEVLGELKIPGVSDYLHPIDENHILGFGLDTPSEEVVEASGWVWYQGVKIAMFDVTDVNNPQELYKEIIGDRGTSTPINYDHHALFYDAERELMAVPVTVAEIDDDLKEEDVEDWQYGDTTFQGAYVYHVSVEDGFELIGKMSHFSESTFEELGEYYYGGERDIERVVRIGEYLYGISQKIISSWDINDIEEVDRIELGVNPKE
jgi:inhibitor of cysteine peptidase